MVLYGSTADSRHRLAYMDGPDVQVFLTVCFLAKADAFIHLGNYPQANAIIKQLLKTDPIGSERL